MVKNFFGFFRLGLVRKRLAFNVPIPDKKKKNFFTLLCGASKCFMKALKTFIKPFEAPQKSGKI